MAEVSLGMKHAIECMEVFGQFLKAHDTTLVMQGENASLHNASAGEVIRLPKESSIPFVILQSPLETFDWSTKQNAYHSHSPKLIEQLFFDQPEAASSELSSAPLVNMELEVDIMDSEVDIGSSEVQSERADIPWETDKTPCAKIQTKQPSSHFRFERQPASTQQRERIIIDNSTNYLQLVIQKKPSKPPHLVIADLRTHNCADPRAFVQQVAMQSWPWGSRSVELHIKTTNHLSNNLDQEPINEGEETGFFVHVRLYTFDAATNSYQFLDELSTSTFRTVSHSKLCSRTRRSATVKNMSKPKKHNMKAKRGNRSEDSEGYSPY